MYSQKSCVILNLMKQIFTADDTGIGKAAEHVRSVLNKCGIRGNENNKNVLTAEEVMGEIIAHADEGSGLSVISRAYLGTTILVFSAPGQPMDFQKVFSPSVPDYWAESDASINSGIRYLILNSRWRNLKYKYKDGCNIIQLTVARPTRSLVLTLGALITAVLAGILLSAFAPGTFNSALDENFLTPVKNMYMNALKMIAAPVVFFSIVVCFSKQSNPLGLGRIGAKILGLYMLTTIIATGVGIGVFHIFRPGDSSAAAAALSKDISGIISKVENISFRNMITDIVPDNFLKPFLESNMMQLLFLAVITGLAVGLIGDYSTRLSSFLEGCSELFLKIVSIVMHVTPLAVFCSILSLVLKTGPELILSILSMLGTFLAGLAAMIIVYSLIMVLAGINPLVFFKRYIPYMVQVFAIASSNASISLNMEACKKDLGIDSKIYSLSIPIGATINMDGTCVLLAVQTLMLAQIYGVTVPAGALITLAVSIILMSVGAPGVPGAGVVILSMLLSLIGVPVEGVTLVMGVGPLIGMFISMTNCLGDVAVTTVVAKSENMVDFGVMYE